MFVQPQQRLHGLDYLRGLAAVGIMAYHYSTWAFGAQEANSFLSRVGIYGVAIFYVLSGQALTYVYASTLSLEVSSLYNFYKKIFFRIFPLFWLATFLSIILSKHYPNPLDLALNLTGLFGLVKWDRYFATGAWSIGNELSFYLVFPLLVFLLNKYRTGLIFAILFSVSAFVYFSFHRIEAHIPLASQWNSYTNPANQFVFFLGGALIGRFINPGAIKVSQSLIMGTIGLAIFILIPISSNTTELVTGLNRLIFTVCCLLICCSFFRKTRVMSILDKPLALLGQASYSIYLFHPVANGGRTAGRTSGNQLNRHFFLKRKGFRFERRPFLFPFYLAVFALGRGCKSLLNCLLNTWLAARCRWLPSVVA